MLKAAEDNPEQIEMLVNLACERDPLFPDVPTIVDQDVPNAEQICSAVGGDDRIFVGPSKMGESNEKRLSALRTALKSALSNEEYLEQAEKADLVGEYNSPEQLEALFKELIATYQNYQGELKEAP